MILAAAVVFVAGGQRPAGRTADLTPQVQQEIQAAVDHAMAISENRMERRIADIEREVDYSRRQQLMVERSAYYGERQ
jgi:hypothetical protein